MANKIRKLVRSKGFETSGSGGGSGGSCTFDGVYQTPSGHVSGTTCQSWINLHFPSQPPSLAIRGTPSFGLYEIGFDIVNPQIDGRGTLGSNPAGTLTLMEFFRGAVGGTSIGNVANPAAGSWVDPTDTFTVSTNQTYSARVTDDQSRIATSSSGYTFVYPWYATTNTITTLTKQALQNGGNHYEFTSVAETDADKEKFDIVDTITITGVEFFNTVSGSWEWINGSKASSLTAFTTSSVSHTVQGNVVNYTRYTHNAIKVGVRQMRFHTD